MTNNEKKNARTGQKGRKKEKCVKKKNDTKKEWKEKTKIREWKVKEKIRKKERKKVDIVIKDRTKKKN